MIGQLVLPGIEVLWRVQRQFSERRKITYVERHNIHADHQQSEAIYQTDDGQLARVHNEGIQIDFQCLHLQKVRDIILSFLLSSLTWLNMKFQWKIWVHFLL